MKPAPPATVDQILDLLPQTQCTRCGYPDCRAYAEAMAAAATNIHNHLCHGEALASTGTTALQAQRVCETIRGMALDSRP